MPALIEDLSLTENNEVHEYGSGETVEPGCIWMSKTVR